MRRYSVVLLDLWEWGANHDCRQSFEGANLRERFSSPCATSDMFVGQRQCKVFDGAGDLIGKHGLVCQIKFSCRFSLALQLPDGGQQHGFRQYCHGERNRGNVACVRCFRRRTARLDSYRVRVNHRRPLPLPVGIHPWCGRGHLALGRPGVAASARCSQNHEPIRHSCRLAHDLRGVRPFLSRNGTYLRHLLSVSRPP
ncbi:hypothetical protein PS928_06165 [Pseudomonas fluorescens]|uniref:Uncharacterized protein n=1 Tax=Pseudomonas fluorescens TaxID=294 RepID=A0A5E7VSD5_PSEFL|nr:hypothetical protein PS928_06165 [Pseudomonas fluorescens]